MDINPVEETTERGNLEMMKLEELSEIEEEMTST